MAKRNAMRLRASILIIILLFITNSFVFATKYYSQGNLPANDFGSWNTAQNGTGNSPLSFGTPSDSFQITYPDSMYTTAAWNVTGLVYVNAGFLTYQHNSSAGILNISGDVYINSGATLTITNGNGAGDDLVIGYANNAGFLKNSGGLVFTGGTGSLTLTGTYIHNLNGGTIPTFTWNTNSNLKITGVISVFPVGLSQNFGKIIYDSPSQTSNVTIANAFTSINSLTINSTGTGSLTLGTNLSLNGDLTLNGGTLDLTSYTVTSPAVLTVNPGATLRVGGPGNFPTFGFYSLLGNSTVDYYYGSAKTIAGRPYGNLKINGAASLGGNTSVQDTVLITGGMLNTGSYSLTIDGVLRINSNGGITGTAPTYSLGSTLLYSTGISYAHNRGGEWNSTAGPGYPYHVRIANNSTLNFGSFQTTIPAEIAGDLSIENGSAFDANMVSSEMDAPFTVMGNVDNKGTLTLSSLTNGGLIVHGNFIYDGTLTSNGRSVTFSGNAAQTISHTGGGYITATFDSLVVDKSANVVTAISSNPNYLGLSIANNLTLNNGILRLDGTISDFNSVASIRAVAGNLDTIANDITFNGSTSITGNVDFWNVNLYGDVDFGTGSRIHGLMRMESGGSVNINPPTYLPNSTLVYLTGGTFFRGDEWSSLSGPGYPYHVEINSTTLLDMGYYGTSTPLAIGGDLFVYGSTLSMNEGENNVTVPLTVYGSVHNSGVIVLSSAYGNALKIGKDFNQSDGVIILNGRPLSFFGSGNSTISGLDTLTNLSINKTSGSFIASQNIIVNDTLFLENGTINTNGYIVEVGIGGTVVRNAGHVNGMMSRYISSGTAVSQQFDIGDDSAYAPVSVTFANVLNGDYLLASTSVSGPALTGTDIDTLRNVNRFWTLTNSAIGYDTYDATFGFHPTDLDSGAQPGQFTLWLHNGSFWNRLTEGMLTDSTTEGIGIVDFGTFVAGELISFEISASATSGGSITPTGAFLVYLGDTVTYSFQPDTGYHFDSLIVDGIVNYDSSWQYTFVNVGIAHSIQAYFSINTYQITSYDIGFGITTPSGATNVIHGDSLTLVFTADPFNHIDSVVIDQPLVLTEQLIPTFFDTPRTIHAKPGGPGTVNAETTIVLYGGTVADSVMNYTFYSISAYHTTHAYYSANPNIPPYVTVALPDTAIARFDTLQFQYTAVDPETGIVKYFILSAPSGTIIDSLTGMLQYIPLPATSGTFPIVVEIFDDSTSITDTAFVRVNLYGDVSGNGTITAFDASKILQHVVNIDTLDDLQQRIGDVSGNHALSALDASYILQYAVGLITSFPGGLGKVGKIDAELSAFSFRIEPGVQTGEYSLYVSLNKPSNTYGISIKLKYDSTIVHVGSIAATRLTDSMSMAVNLPGNRAMLAMAGIQPMNAAGDIAMISFAILQKNYPKNATLFTMEQFMLNETEHAGDIGGITLSVRGFVSVPDVYSLSQNFPNPFNPATTIKYDLPENSTVRITVYNVLGQAVNTLVNEQQPAGYYSVQWNGTNHDNKQVASGMYIYRIEAAGSNNRVFTQVRKMLLLR